MEDGVLPSQIRLINMEIWVRIFDIPIGYFLEKTRKLLGDFIGEFLEYDAKNNLSIWRDFMRIRTRIDVRLPLKRCKKIMISGGRAVKVKFQYEKLPIFCFICDRIGHMDKFCPKLLGLKHEGEELPREWSVGLRVDLRKAMGSGDKRWLQDGKGERVMADHTSEGSRAGNCEWVLTLAGLEKATPMEGVIPAHQHGKSLVKESLNFPMME